MSNSKTLPLDAETYLMGRDKQAPLNDEMRANMTNLLLHVNMLFEEIAPSLAPLYCGINCGYRPEAINTKTKGAATHSAHMTCEAVDLSDPTGKLAEAIRARVEWLEAAQLYMEHPNWTYGWVHLTTRPTINRVFIPY